MVGFWIAVALTLATGLGVGLWRALVAPWGGCRWRVEVRWQSQGAHRKDRL